MTDAGGSDGGALPPGNTEPSAQVARSIAHDWESPAHDLPEHAPGPVAGESAPATEDVHSSRQQPCAPQALSAADLKQFRQFQSFMSRYPNGFPVEYLQASASAASTPASASTTNSQVPDSSSTLAASQGPMSTKVAYTSASQSQEDQERDYSIELSDDSDDPDHKLVNDSNADITPYNPRDEGQPITQIHHPSFGKAEVVHTDILRRFLDILHEPGHEKDSDIQFLKKDGHKQIQNTHHPASKVALRGAAGTGKSSLINSLLASEEEVAMKSGGIRACTAVVQEFSARTPESEGAFSTEIEFIPEASRKAALMGYLSDFFTFQERDPNDEDGNYQELSSGSGTCLEALTSMFANHKELEDNDSTEKFLLGFEGCNDPVLVGRLLAWLRENMKQLQVDLDLNKIFISADDAGSLTRRLEPFLKSSPFYSENGDRRPSLWPMVHHVRTSLESPLLDQGIVLVDLPGTGDSNQTRTTTSNEYMHKVDHTMVVVAMDRNVTNEKVQDELLQAFRRRNSGSSTVVVTKADVVSPEVDPNHDLRIQGSRGADVPTMAEKIFRAEAEFNALDHNVQLELKAGDWPRAQQLIKQRDDCGVIERRLRRRYFRFLRNGRNNETAHILRKAYRQRVKDNASLAVFCVSNTVYRNWVLGIKPATPGGITVKETNIPALRQHLYRLPALKKFDALEHQCKHRLPNFLAIVEMTCSQSKMERMEALDEIISSPRRMVKKLVSIIYEEVKQELVKSVLKKTKNSRRKWAGAVEKDLEEWSKWNDGTYKAVCRRNGVFKNAKYGVIDWNAKLLSPVARDLKTDLAKWDQASTVLSGKLCEEFELMMNKLQFELEEKAGPAKDYLSTFFSTLKEKKKELFTLAENAGKDLDEELGSIKDNMISTTNPNHNYFIACLKPHYQKCANICGKGAHENRTTTFEEFVNDSKKGPYMAINYGARDGTKKTFNRLSEELAEEVLSELEHLQQMFSTNFNTEEEETPEAIAIREKLRKELVHARRIIEVELKPHLDNCRNAGIESNPPRNA
ncbi:hypothetical protein IWX90DRAFT_484711 [Phyllosticta citrichinensis]|uniref:Uncharacterized protein n=1 Tax=Phyllosticta citrichinensis TaxID=1130410 RepID=A0ABR1XZQ1_9PEZI